MHRDRPGEPTRSNAQRMELPHDDKQLDIVEIKRIMALIEQADQQQAPSIDVISEPVPERECVK